MSGNFYITTPIYYVNARPHLGHAYTTIAADVMNRFRKMQRLDTYFLTGTDEHGDKIIRSAAAENLSPREYVDKISGMFRALWPELNISNDQFIRTTDPNHIRVVERILQQIYDSGEIYFSEYEGKYCFGCERFYTDRELVNGKCPDHETEPEIIRESNYFFKMSKYQDWLIDHLKNNPDFIRPERYKNEVLGFLREPLEDLCISRPKSRLKWGITLPFDSDYVTYVWFDALINYVSALGGPDGEKFKKYWPSVQHVVAKDILKPHGIYWPIMLKAAGIPLYKHLNVHGYWNVDEMKMSKSIGNVADPLQLRGEYGLDPFRFFLMRDMVFGLDSNFSENAIVSRINADLANDLGNLLNRVLAMTHKYFKGVIPETDPVAEKELADFGMDGVEKCALETISEYESSMENFQYHKALMATWGFVSHLNKYVDVAAPWELAKKKSGRGQLQTVMYQLLEGLRIISGLVYPFMPDSAEKMQRQLGNDPETEPASKKFYFLDVLRSWKTLPSGGKVTKSKILFPRIDLEKKAAAKGEETADEKPASVFKPEITLDDLGKIDLRVARVIRAEPVPKADKLLKLEIDLGEKRTIVAGIAKMYAPEDLVGREIIVVANLKPAKIMGVKSNGMLLAATGEKGPVFVTVDEDVKPGTPLR